MKKMFIILLSIILSFNAVAYEFKNGREYTQTKKIIHNIPNIIEFFSFFCPYCYEFEKIHHIQYLTKNNFKKNISFQKYHVNFLGGKLSPILTKSWIIAQQMGIEKKIILPIFQGIQDTHTIHNINDIKKIFKNKAGINENQFNNFWNSLTLKILIKKINQDIKKSHLDHIPMILINGKYIIDYDKLEKIFHKNFSKKYIELINFLIQKK
ncbi:DsbA family protein [Buchnera aphidicola]|uniref:Thiol:disulfide interchange protein n=1 Tax=Buchnera aphidicola str. Ua (Uroleucon ambrosiae) TaxID=1005057 RepID=G2LPS1_BUCUM|nr:DsbA family protein [Buchnera aphidicola]AEO08208.1 thiol:disulfide interchange protein DsbA precursor [Buchnera aphidicola str. Ua (Uroleucon ambrosiae)]